MLVINDFLFSSSDVALDETKFERSFKFDFSNIDNDTLFTTDLTSLKLAFSGIFNARVRVWESERETFCDVIPLITFNASSDEKLDNLETSALFNKSIKKIYKSFNKTILKNKYINRKVPGSFENWSALAFWASVNNSGKYNLHKLLASFGKSLVTFFANCNLFVVNWLFAEKSLRKLQSEKHWNTLLKLKKLINKKAK